MTSWLRQLTLLSAATLIIGCVGGGGAPIDDPDNPAVKLTHHRLTEVTRNQC